MLGRIINGISVVAFYGALVLGLRYVIETIFSADTPVILRAAVIALSVLAFIAGYVGEKGADKSGEDNAN